MEHAFRVDLRGVIDLLANHLYSDAGVFIRELLQNAVDAIRARQGLGQEFEPEIEVRVGRGPDGLPTLEFRDNGVGLRQDEVHEFLSTIGRSSKRISEARGTFLGQFGIGLLSCFMVSAEIELLTQSAHGGPPVRWLARSDGRYRLDTLSPPPGAVQPGTTVLLRARQATDFHFGYDGLRGALASYGQILPYPIHVWGDGQYSHVNPALPPWLALAAGDAGRTGEVLAYAREVLGLEALDAIPLCSAVGGVQGVALVLPYSAHPGVRPRHQVYLRRMLLGHDVRNLLPEWAFFVRCLLNVEALHPTASREAFYEDGALDKARAALDAQLRGYIEGLARHDPRRLHALIALHHLPIKALALSDDALYRLLIHEFSFETSTGRRTLGEYVNREARLRVVSTPGEFRQIAQVAQASGHSVINAAYTYDLPLLRKYPSLFPVPLEEVDPQAYALALEDAAALGGQAGLAEFCARASAALRALGCQVGVKRFDPPELPALLIVTRERSCPLTDGPGGEAGQDSAELDAEAEPARVSRLHLNLKHPLVQELLYVQDRAVFGRLVQMLYVQAHLLGHHALRGQELTLLGEGLGDMMRWGLRASRQELLN